MIDIRKFSLLSSSSHTSRYHPESRLRAQGEKNQTPAEEAAKPHSLSEKKARGREAVGRRGEQPLRSW